MFYSYFSPFLRLCRNSPRSVLTLTGGCMGLWVTYNRCLNCRCICKCRIFSFLRIITGISFTFKISLFGHPGSLIIHNQAEPLAALYLTIGLALLCSLPGLTGSFVYKDKSSFIERPVYFEMSSGGMPSAFILRADSKYAFFSPFCMPIFSPCLLSALIIVL